MCIEDMQAFVAQTLINKDEWQESGLPQEPIYPRAYELLMDIAASPVVQKTSGWLIKTLG